MQLRRLATRPFLGRIARLCIFVLALLVECGAFVVAAPVSSPTIPETNGRAISRQRLFLEVFINGTTANLVAEIIRRRDGSLGATRGELRQIGVATPNSGDDKDVVSLDAIPGLGVRYEERLQQLHLTLGDEIRIAREYSADAPTGAITQRKLDVSSDYGTVVNYNLFGTGGRGYNSTAGSYSTGSVSLDARSFSPYGVLQQTAIAGTSLSKKGILRLDSQFVFAHRDSMTVATLGDSVSGGLNWTRPIRHGGAQVSRQFSLRSDLVTSPLPSVSGSAAVPSTVDVYVDNVRVASQQVGAGPYRITSLPVPSESGSARIVVRDITGKETVTAMPFFTSAKLLAKGNLDYALDAGFPRLNYALESFDYSKRFMGMGSVRYGLTDWLTTEAHMEGTARLGVAGAGAVFSGGQLGLFSIAGAGSWFGGNIGAMTYASWQKNLGGFFLGVSSQRTFGRYEDVASVTAQNNAFRTSQNLADSGFYTLQRSPRVSKAIDRFTLGVPLPNLKASFSLSFINIERATKDKSHLINMSYSQILLDKYNIFLSGYGDIANKRDVGVVAGLSFPLGPELLAQDVLVTSSASATRSGWSGGIEISKAMGQQEKDFGWRVFDNEGQTTQRGAVGAYRSPWARLEAGVRQDRNTVGGHGEVDGAVVLSPKGVFLSNRINDAFAIVDAGTPNVEVLHENRPVGKTGWNGKLIVPNLQSFQKSKIAINPDSLSHDKLANVTEADVLPGYRGSTTVEVKSLSVQETARVELRNSKGEHFPVGTKAQHVEANATYTIGYGGTAYLREIDDQNTLIVQHGTGTCRATFVRTDRKGIKGNVGPLTCMPD